MGKVILWLLLVLLMGCHTEGTSSDNESEPDYSVFYGTWIPDGGGDHCIIGSDGTATVMGYDYTYVGSGATGDVIYIGFIPKGSSSDPTLFGE